MRYRVVFAPEAEEQLLALYRFISKVSANPEIARRYTEAIVDYCESMSEVPHRGTRRDDIRPGLRITH
jgi:plasmid stabilization system protein ParE